MLKFNDFLLKSKSKLFFYAKYLLIDDKDTQLQNRIVFLDFTKYK
jgi:hypothetical protein